MPGQGHQRAGLARGQDAPNLVNWNPRQFRQRLAHAFALTAERRVLDKVGVERAGFPGLGDAFGGGRLFAVVGFLLQPQAQLAIEILAGAAAEIMARRQPLDDRGADKAGNAPDGAGGQIGAQGQRQLPGFDFLRLLYHPLQGRLANGGVGIDQQRGNGGDVE